MTPTRTNSSNNQRAPAEPRARAWQPKFIAVVFAVIAGACGSDSGKTSTTAGDSPAAGEKNAAPAAQVAAEVSTLIDTTFTEIVSATGVVAPRTGHVASLSAPGPARVTQIHVALGDHVKEGDAIISFETTTFDAAVASADAAMNVAELAAARARRLVEAGVSPRKDLELATSELAVSRSASVTAHRSQQLSRLTAPVEGAVTKLSAVMGANVDVGQVLVEVTDVRFLDVQLLFMPSAAAKIRAGQSVMLREGSDDNGSTFARGRVADVSAIVDSASRGVLVRVAVDSPVPSLRIGQSLYGSVPVTTHAHVIVIPDEALVPTGEGFRVFVVDRANVAAARDVTVGGRNGHRVWISEGLKVGETIVTTGAYGVDEGATVVTGKPAKP